MSIFELINGIGPKTAESLESELGKPKDLDDAYEMLKSIFARLPIVTQQDITYRPLKIIPYNLIEYIEKLLPKNMVIAGSYRRKTPYSSDIDIVTLSPNPIKTIADAAIHEISIVNPYSDGKDRISCLFHLKNFGFHVKCDFFITNQEGFAYMLFYATGSKLFNIRMRKLAQKLGMKLNQYGLFKRGKLIEALSEEEIMTFLRLDYIKPEDRIH